MVEGNSAKLTFDFNNEENFKYIKAYLEGEVLVVEGKEKCFVKNYSLIGNIMGQVLAFPKIEEKTRFDEWDHY